MSKAILFAALVGFAGLVSACGNTRDDYVVVQPEPISTEPVFTGKLK
ncbi:hypothetical protein ACFO5X_04480 [Seohaeicola nanhaiensis]|uniref:Lipoprotein n=1 Tax=Seohaeicola nanhaiensis TaxID=1387282 RepID=A0ABV9KC74_9RHOB